MEKSDRVRTKDGERKTKETDRQGEKQRKIKSDRQGEN